MRTIVENPQSLRETPVSVPNRRSRESWLGRTLVAGGFSNLLGQFYVLGLSVAMFPMSSTAWDRSDTA